ncbi:ribosome assembly RNA-binding protein YhbY [Aerosticca soli]|jgi:RNA-binding protein
MNRHCRMPLSSSQRRYLRGLAHELSPVILLGAKGASAAVLAELDRALLQHELVKVKLAGDREERAAQADVLLEGTGAEAVQQIGHMLVLFRRNEDEPKLALPR